MSKNLLNIKSKEEEFLIALVSNCNITKEKVYNGLCSTKNSTFVSDNTLNSICIKHNNTEYTLVNLPNINTLYDLPEDKLITRDFLCFANPDCILLLCNEDSLESDLNLLFELLDLSINIILYVNVNSASTLDKKTFELELGLPIIFSSSEDKPNIYAILKILNDITSNMLSFNINHLLYECNTESVINSFNQQLENNFKNVNPRWLALKLIDNDESFFKSMNFYLDNESLNNLDNIKEVFPKTLDVKRVQNNFLSRRNEYTINVKNKVYLEKSDNNINRNFILKMPRKSVISYLYFLLIIIVTILLF